MPRSPKVLTAALLLLPALAADAYGQRAGELLVADQGVRARGGIMVVSEGTGTCNVLETDTTYEEKKRNDGAPMDLWRLDFSVRNGSGRWLDHVIAKFEVESEWPERTNWDEPRAVDAFMPHFRWFAWIETIQERGCNVVSPDQVLTATQYFIVLRSDPPPQITQTTLIFYFAIAPPSTGGTAAPASPSAGSPERENLLWQSIMNSADPADFEAYLEQCPGGVFRRLAKNRRTALRARADNAPAAAPDRNPPRGAGRRHRVLDGAGEPSRLICVEP